MKTLLSTCWIIGLMLACIAPDAMAQAAPPWPCPLPASTPAGTRDSCFMWFNRGTGFANDNVTAIQEHTGGALLIGGLFTSFHGLRYKGLCRLLPNGRIDSTFVSGLNYLRSAQVYTLVKLQSGKYLASGKFESDSGWQGIVRLNPDGTLDGAYQSPKVDRSGHLEEFQTNNTVFLEDGRAIVRWPDSSSFGATLTRLKEDGRLDTSFQASVPDSAYKIWAISSYPNGKIGVLWSTNYKLNVKTRWMLSRLHPDGNLDTAFHFDKSTTGYVGTNNTGLLPLSSGRLIVSGIESSYPSQLVKSSFIVNENGTTYSTTIFPGLVSGYADEQNYGPALFLTDGCFQIAAYRPVSIYSGLSFLWLETYTPEGVLDTAYIIGEPGFGFSANHPGGSISAMCRRADGTILLGGDIQSVGPSRSFRRPGLIQIDSIGKFDPVFGVTSAGFDAPPTQVHLLPNGKILTSRGSGVFNNRLRKGLIYRLNGDGSMDTTFSTAFMEDSSFVMDWFYPLASGKILVPVHHTYDDWRDYVDRIIRLNPDGSLDDTYRYANPYRRDWGFHITGVYVQPGGAILFSHTTRGTGPITRLNADGVWDLAYENYYTERILGNRPNGNCIVQTKTDSATMSFSERKPDGTFDHLIGNARVNGRTVLGQVTVQPDGKILYTTYQYSSTTFNKWYGPYRLNADGTRDSAFAAIDYGGAHGEPFSNLTLQPDGKILFAVGGRITRLNPNGRLDSTLNMGAGANLERPFGLGLNLTGDGKLLVYGNFSEYNGKSVAYIAKLFLTEGIITENATTINPEALTLNPNPSSGRIRLQTPEQGEIRVFNLQGQLIHRSWKRGTDPIQIDLSSLPKGLYILQLGKEQAKVVKE